MFRRRWSGLPKDPTFPADLKQLGYFINEKDEIRSIDDPDCYFKYFLTKNERVNVRHRFAFNDAVESIIHKRIRDLGLEEKRLPLEAAADKPHTRIFVSKDLRKKSRVVMFVGETSQILGTLALRVANGPGGINEGSLIPFIQIIQSQRSSPTDDSHPGIILGNLAEYWWWPEGKKALTPTARNAVPLPSAVHYGRAHNKKINEIPGNQDPVDHVESLFADVIGRLARPDVLIDVVGIGDGADYLHTVLEEPLFWYRYRAQIHAVVKFGGTIPVSDIVNEGFRDFLRKRGRVYLCDIRPLGTRIPEFESSPNNDDNTHGCPVYSSGHAEYTECIAIASRAHSLAWLQEVALDPNYQNPPSQVAFESHASGEEKDEWSNEKWPDSAAENTPRSTSEEESGKEPAPDSLPSISFTAFMTSEEVDELAKQLREMEGMEENEGKKWEDI